MTYLYGFTKYAGSDKIWKLSGKLKAGDLFQFGEDYYLSLGDEISFFEQYVYEIREPEDKFKLIEKNLISKETIQFINYMVYERYCPYHSVMKYFLPHEIDKLVERKVGKKKNNTSDGQILTVFPDLRTLINLTDKELRKKPGVDTLLSTNTQNQKDKSRRNIKLGNTKFIFATHSEIFQNYNDLKKIIIYYPHKWYYANQQDPRYKTLAVVKKMSEIYNCRFETIEN